MRPQLDDSKRRDLVNYRLSRSHNALEEVEYLVKGDYFSSAISRLYYSCYYAAVALLVANKLETQTHAGVKSMLSKILSRQTSLTVNMPRHSLSCLIFDMQMIMTIFTCAIKRQ